MSATVEETIDQLNLAKQAIHAIRNAWVMIAVEGNLEPEASRLFANMANELTNWIGSLTDLQADYALKQVYPYRGLTTDLSCKCGAELIETADGLTCCVCNSRYHLKGKK